MRCSAKGMVISMRFVLVKDEYTSETGRKILEALHESLTSMEEESTIIELLGEDSYEECLPFFLELNAEAAVTADMAGFHTLNKEGETVFNSMYCTCVHILTKEPWHYPDELLKRMNFTTCVVTADERQKAYLERHYENIPQVCAMEKLGEGHPFSYEEPEQIKKRLALLPGAFSEMAAKIMSDWKNNSILCDEIDGYLKKKRIPCTEDERIELCALFKDIPLYFQMKKTKPEEEKAAAEDYPSSSLIMSIISLMREG